MIGIGIIKQTAYNKAKNSFLVTDSKVTDYIKAQTSKGKVVSIYYNPKEAKDFLSNIIHHCKYNINSFNNRNYIHLLYIIKQVNKKRKSKNFLFYIYIFKYFIFIIR